MKKNRRDFLKLAGATALGVGSACALPHAALAAGGKEKTPYEPEPLPEGMSKPENALTATHWAMVIDTRKMADPVLQKKCIAACHDYHNVPTIESDYTEVKWLWTDTFYATFKEKNYYLAEDVQERQFLLLCNHCENPPCVRVCPTKATFKRKSDGIVIMDMHRCIGCRFCMAGCPYGARSFNFKNPEPYIKNMNPDYPMRMMGVVEKCSFCSERLAFGKMPACVEASEGGILFGDLDDPKSTVREALRENYSLRRKTMLGTEPSVYYII